MKPANATNIDRKSGVAEWRDLRFHFRQKRIFLLVFVSQDDGHAQAGSKQGLKDGENRPAAAGAKIDYLRKLRFLKQIAQKRHCRRMELKALLHKL